MEFEEMKKIWDKQNQQPLYVINEEALHNRIRAKKGSAGHIANFSEVFIILANIAGAAIILISSYIKAKGDIYTYVLAGLMVVAAVYVFIGRIRRKRRESKFNQSLRGDLDHAITNATFQVRLSQIMRWFVLPVGILTILALWQNQTQIWLLLLILLFSGYTWYASGWEHQIYVRKKLELEMLNQKLAEEAGTSEQA